MSTNILVSDHGKKLSVQDIFDIVLKRAENKKACKNTINGKKNKCAYRNSDNTNCCLVGALIPDSVYQIYFEGEGIRSLFNRHKKIYDLFENEIDIVPILIALQDLHDNCYPQEWNSILENMIAYWKLKNN
jgi:hypothetical protein